MKRLFFKYFLFFAIVFLCYNCARTGNPEGGEKDEEAPLFVSSKPPYETTNFKKTEVKIYFNEYIKLSDLNKQLIVSPPLKTPLSVTPQGAATNFLKLEILDTLKENTTYIFNFGNAISDNNEGNELEAFKYVFSTGSYIDSLTTSGTVKDAFLEKTPDRVSLLLYQLDSTFTDSIVFKQKPNYVANTLDSTIFKFTNLKEGQYKIIALKEAANDYIFSPQIDKIGFLTDTIFLPKDSILEKPIVFFKEEQPYRFRRGKEISKGMLQFSFDGKITNFKVNLISNRPENFKSISKLEKDRDSLNYWYTPFETDSLNFIVSNASFLDTVTVRLRKKKIDSLLFSSSSNGNINFRDTFFLRTNNPIITIDTSKISLVDKDTLAISFETFLDKKENKIVFLFDKKQKQKYIVNILPEAFTDLFEQKNDTLAFSLSTKEIEDYGRITLTVKNTTQENVILELIEDTDVKNALERTFITTSKTIVYDLLEPKKYRFRAIIDRNKNNKWDTGNYLLKIQPEKIIYFNTVLELRANYYLNETFTIND